MPAVRIAPDPIDAGNPLLWILAPSWASPPRVIRAWHESEQAAVVQFDAAVKARSELDADDALYLTNWTATALSGQTIPALLRVEFVDTGYAGGEVTTRVRLRWTAPVARQYDQVRIAASVAILAADGITPIAASDATCDGAAPALRPYTEATTRTIGWQDLAMRSAGAGAGALIMTEAGDYALATTVESVRKVVQRILATAAGEFAHLPGWGAAAGLKTLGRAPEIERITSAARRAILSLPAVEACAVSASLSSNGILVQTARVRVRRLGLVVVSWEPTGTGMEG